MKSLISRIVGIDRAKQQRAGIRGDRPAIEPGDRNAAGNLSNSDPLRATLCRRRSAPLLREILLLQNNYRRFRAPTHLRT